MIKGTCQPLLTSADMIFIFFYWVEIKLAVYKINFRVLHVALLFPYH